MLSKSQHPNPEWQQRLGEIQEVYFQRTQDGLLPEQRVFRVTRSGMNGVKRSNSSLIPEVHTSHAQEVGCSPPTYFDGY